MTPESKTSPALETADCDLPYTWGRPPSTYLALREVARLMILRSRLDERDALHRKA
jgi:hypothetical protein